MTLKEGIARILACPAPILPAAGPRREGVWLAATALAVGGLVFAYKLRQFLGLGTTSDLYIATQLATAWLDGRFLHDNFYGNHLAIHTYLLGPLLAVLAGPFGAVGLLGFLGIAAGLSVVAVVKILRLLAVPAGPALLQAAAVVLMPFSVHVLQDNIYGFHFELLEPVLALWLAYFLLRRHWAGSLSLAVALILVKEDAPLLVVTVALMVLAEDLVRSDGRGGGRRWNAPATAVLLLAFVAVPVLLFILRTQQVADAPGNLARLNAAGTGGITSNAGLVAYCLGHFGSWLRSDAVAGWLGAALPATFGLIVLRPHLLIAGLATTLIAWLMQDSLLWAPRFAPALAFYQIAGCLAFTSVWRWLGDDRARNWRGVLGVVGGCVVGLCWWQQWRTVPRTAELYRLDPALAISPADRRKADELFAQFRRESRRDEPVMAAPYLFRYAHDRNLLWPHVLRNRPAPVWILWDTQEAPLKALWVMLKTDVGIDLADYELKGQADRFVLIKRRAPDSRGSAVLPGFVPVALAGDNHGAVALQVRFAPGRAGSYEPLLSVGPKGHGDVFFVHYLNERQLELGMESMGTKVSLSGPVDYEAGRIHELELFSGSMQPPAGAAPSPREEIERLYHQNLVSVRWDGREVLNTLAPPRAAGPGETFAGFNVAQAGSAGPAFSGEIIRACRTQLPPLPGEPDCGAVRLVVQLPDTGTGRPEPLLVVGEAGRATLGYVHVLPAGRAKFGAEFWGVGAFESEELAAPAAAAEIIFQFPALYPPVGDSRWGAVSREEQQARRSRLTIRVNGQVVLDREVKETPVPPAPLAFGRNPVGGSWVGEKFTGRLLQGMRLPLTGPVAPAR